MHSGFCERKLHRIEWKSGENRPIMTHLKIGSGFVKGRVCKGRAWETGDVNGAMGTYPKKGLVKTARRSDPYKSFNRRKTKKNFDPSPHGRGWG